MHFGVPQQSRPAYGFRVRSWAFEDPPMLATAHERADEV